MLVQLLISKLPWPCGLIMLLVNLFFFVFFFFSSRRRHTRLTCDWSSDVCSSDLRRCVPIPPPVDPRRGVRGGSEGAARAAPRAVRVVARRRRRRSRRGAGGDRRLSPRARLSVTRGAGPPDRAGEGDRPSGGGPLPGLCSARFRARRRVGRRGVAPARGRSPSRRRSGAPARAVRPRAFVAARVRGAGGAGGGRRRAVGCYCST